MAGIDVPNDNSYGLRTGVTAEQLDRARREYEAARDKDAQLKMTAFTAGAVLICVGAGWLFNRRSRLAAVTESAPVDVAAKSLTTGRKINSAARTFANRVRERADPNRPEA
jgi:hypothetical protein